MCENISLGCDSIVQCIGYFGSYTSKEDYVEGISDINVFVVLKNHNMKNKYLLELASSGCSPVVLADFELKLLCQQGEVICYYILYDSKLVCGELPKFEFQITERTKIILKNNIISYYVLGINALLRGDEISELNNFYKTVRALIRFISVENLNIIPLRDKDVIEICRIQNLGEVCNLFEFISNSRKNRERIGLHIIEQISKILSDTLKINFPELFNFYDKRVMSIDYKNGRFYIKYLDGKEESL